ncbi:hypothetical protein DDE82_004440 [Stemphylium lycopersici]|uniref:DUF6594 domain-containing protein n=1 Tax=Stemphylium lycopersici TaxID=183478 RepID=A0A364MWH9_STELY|nr:hypothetical protein TW65_05337 [Stemphylium lycopersici]RAR04485.1 hypothetical protein DDE82_004440 [Stemphylium lycopersici]RAR05713.1 hypothetical protein DDE83_007282 [Stemphylium lycopersici]
MDKNADRLALLEEIEKTMDDYGTSPETPDRGNSYQTNNLDTFTENSRRMLNSEGAEQRDLESLQNWLDGNACLARQESAYLDAPLDMVSLAPCKDSAVSQLEVWVENKLIRFYQNFRNNPQHNLSVDPNVYLYSGHLIRRIARAFLLVLITALLLLPVVICNLISGTSVRIVIIMFSTITYLSILSGLTRSRTMELVLAGATYTTVLIVFVSGSNGM